MHGAPRMVGWMVLLAMTMTSGCSSSVTEPRGPSVAGTWTGDFRGSVVRMVVSQSGGEVAGTFDVGARSYALTGTVSEAGSFAFSTDVDPTDCSGYGSSGLQLAEAGTELSGIARRASSAPPCGSAGRVLVEQGTMALSRAF